MQPQPQPQKQQQQDQAATTSTPAADKTATTPTDDDEPAEAPPAAAGRGSSDRRPRRGAVSAEVYSEDDAANYVKTVGYNTVNYAHALTYIYVCLRRRDFLYLSLLSQ